MKPGPRRGRRAPNRRAGFEYYPTTRIAHFEVYEPGTRKKRRLTLHDIESRDRAEKLWADFKAKVKGRAKHAKLVSPTLREFVRECFDDIRAEVRENTAVDYLYAIERHILPEFGDMLLAEITTGKVNRWTARLIGQGYSGATVNGYRDVAVLLLGRAYRWDILEVMPVKTTALKRYAVNLPCNELSGDEEQRFLAVFADEPAFREWIAKHMPRGEVREISGSGAKHQLFGARRVYGASIRADSEAAGEYFRRFRLAKPLFVVAVETGLRRGDLLRLKWTQVDLKSGIIGVVTGKTRRKAFIPISKRCRAALSECRAKPVVGEFVFTDAEGRAFAEKTIVRYFAIAKELAGFGKRPFRFHDLRHTYGSKLAREGVNIEFIAATMAHSSTRMTQRYARPGDTAIQKVRQALDAAADGDAADEATPVQIQSVPARS